MHCTSQDLLPILGSTFFKLNEKNKSLCLVPIITRCITLGKSDFFIKYVGSLDIMNH